ncbi:MAG: hypothetical protein IJV35_00745 [Neisseriaceae bacterium]|nr:hypothetical protein [Neisseriaceae bacterium]
MKQTLMFLCLFLFNFSAFADEVLFDRLFTNVQSIANVVPVNELEQKAREKCDKNNAQGCAVQAYLQWYYRSALQKNTTMGQGEAVLSSLGIGTNEDMDKLAGENSKQNWYKAENILQKACKKNNVAACYNILQISNKGYIQSDEEKIKQKTLALAKKECAKNNGQACFIQAMLSADEVPYKNSSDNEIIAEKFRKSCDLNYGDACYFRFLLQYDKQLENNEKIDDNGLALLEKSCNYYQKEQATGSYDYSIVDINNTCERLKELKAMK